jgi:hypothetical protein
MAEPVANFARNAAPGGLVAQDDRGKDVMKRNRALIGAVLLAGLHASSAKAWDDYPGPQLPGIDGIVVGDFDGNGTREAAVGAQSQPYYYFSGSALLAVLGAGSGGTLGLRAMSMLPTPMKGPLVLARREGAADRLAAVVGSDASSQILVLGGVPLRILKTIEAPLLQRVAAVADVDADGRAEIVGLAGTSPWSDLHPVVLDYETGALEWTGADVASGIGVAQLDADAALELIVAGTPGRIVDGATHAAEWTYPSGFEGKIVAGRFDANPSVAGFAVANSGGRVQIFRSQPYSPVSEFRTDDSMLTAAEVVHVTPGGPDLIAVGGWRASIYDPRSGQRIAQIPVADGNVRALSSGDIDADGHEELVVGADSRLQATDLVTMASDYAQASESGPHVAVAVGDVSGTGSEQVVYLTGGGSPSDKSTLRVLDAASGTRLRARADALNPWTHEPPQIALAQFDGDPQKEIVVAGADMYQGEVAVLDGMTLADQWRVGGYGSIFDGTSIRAVSVVDANADGVPEVVVATFAGRLVVLDGRTGALIWQSVTLDGATPPSLAVFTSSGHPRAAIARGTGLYLFDIGSRLLVASAKAAAPLIGIWRWGDAAACRIAAVDEDAVLTIHRCDTLDALGQHLLPEGTVFFRPLDPLGMRFIAASGPYLYEITPDDQAIALSDALGGLLGAANSGIVRNGSDAQHFDVIIGSDYMVTRRQVGLDALFANGFD